MKVLSSEAKITYSEDVDILMIQLSNKKVDDSYDTDQMIVQVDKTGEPVLLEIFQGKKFLENISRALPQKIKQEIWPKTPTSIAHHVK
jgi:uncharacterized protein YuzE